MTNTDLDARAARAMGFRFSMLGDAVCLLDAKGDRDLIDWSPTTDHNHFAEMLERINECAMGYRFIERLRILADAEEMSLDEWNAAWLTAARQDLAVLAACEALESA